MSNSTNENDLKQEKAWAVDKGQKREQNEDSVAAVDLNLVDGDNEQSVGIYAVADGMGGEAHGEVASSLAVHTMVDEIIQRLVEANVTVDVPYKSWLENAVKAANATIMQDGREMGTTLVTAIVVGHSAYIANVGDSRAYILNPDGMQQITEDQTIVQVLLKSGAIGEDQVADHPYRNILHQAVGKDNDIEPDLYEVDVKQGNYLLLCSDGLTNELGDQKIHDIVMQSDSPQSACDVLVDKANKHGGKDNISILIVKLS